MHKMQKWVEISIIDPCQFVGKTRSITEFIYNLRYLVPRQIPVIMENESNYGFHFLIQHLTDKFEDSMLKCLSRHIAKWKKSLSSIRQKWKHKAKKQIKNQKKKLKKVSNIIKYILKVIKKLQIMQASLSDVTNNLW